MRVKICGITNLEDALVACEAGADALGFVFYPPSSRFITLESAKKIIKELPPFIERVGLFVNHTPSQINKIMHFCKLSTAQLHFEIDEKFINQIEFNVLPVVRAQKEDDINKFSGKYRLIDAFVEGYGGEGKRLNLEWFKNKDNSKIILAGGLRTNVLNELKGFGFYGVDVSSGVEKEKGKKDHKKIFEFIKMAKGMSIYLV